MNASEHSQTFRVFYRQPMFPGILYVDELTVGSLEDVVMLFRYPGYEGYDLVSVQALSGEL